jgi:hypothetical protein
MKKLLASLLMLATFGAQASSLAISNSTHINSFIGYNGQPASVTGTYTTGDLGTLVALTGGVFSATYLGQESGYVNQFKFLDINGITLTENDALGKTISMDVNAGVVGFKFWDSQGAYVQNGGPNSSVWASFAILAAQCNTYGCFDYVLGFNDGYTGDADYDDFVVGVNLAPVPLPAAGWMFLSALVGFVSMSNRRKV